MFNFRTNQHSHAREHTLSAFIHGPVHNTCHAVRKWKATKTASTNFSFKNKQTNVLIRMAYAQCTQHSKCKWNVANVKCYLTILYFYWWIELKIRSNSDDYMQISISCFEMVWWIFALRCRKIPSSFFSFCYNSTCNKQLKVFSEINHESCDNRSNYHWKLYVYV